jgi:hypothetical protein
LLLVKKALKTDPWSHLYSARRRVIACATVIEEMLPYLPADVPQILDFGLHLQPEKLKQALQEKIDEASRHADVILLGYGLCSMAVVGLRASSAAIVMTRSDDCIAMFLGSRRAYRQQREKEPGTYYLTKGWIEVGDTPFDEYERLAKKYGVERADKMIKLMLKNYTRLAFIITGQGDTRTYRSRARQNAARFGLRYEEIQGSPALLKKMIHGPWDDEFVVVPPGETSTYQQFAVGTTGLNENAARSGHGAPVTGEDKE